MMAFGHEWENEERLRKICSDIITLAERPEWKSLEIVCKVTGELQGERYHAMKDILEVRENAGVIAGMKKVLAFPEYCRQVLNHAAK